MFVENKGGTTGRVALRLDALARRRPWVFDTVLALLAAVVTVALLYQTGYSFVLYQGF